VVGRCREWPGATAVASATRQVCVYFGSAQFFEDRRVEPPRPLPVATEWTPNEEESGPYVEQADVLSDPLVPVVVVEEEETGQDDAEDEQDEA
jgi:hypothetical protein